MRTCIFCGHSGKLSKEHAWPNWLLELLKQNKTEAITITGSRNDGWSGKIYGVNAAILIKKFCRQKCNAGWMKKLEDEAQPILTKMIRGENTALSSLEQLTVSSWLTKTSMVFDSIGPWPFFNGLDRTHFYRNLTPLDITNVWLAHYSGSHLRAFTAGRSLDARERPDGPLLVKLNVHTFVFDRLIMQIVSGKQTEYRPAHQINLQLRPGLWDNSTTLQIWPVSLHALAWPPPLSFDDSERPLESFVDRFGGPSTFPQLLGST